MITIKLLPLLYALNLFACLFAILLFFHRRLHPELIRGLVLCYVTIVLWFLFNILTAAGLVENSMFLYKTSQILPFIMASFLFYYALCLGNKRIIKKTHLLSLIPAITMMILIYVIKDNSPPQFKSFDYGIVPICSPKSFISIISPALTLAYLLVTIVLIIKNILDGTQKRYRFQNTILLLQVFLALVVSLVGLILFFTKGVPLQITYSLGPFFYGIGTFIVVIRYRLKLKRPSHILEKIWFQIKEPLILLDSEKNINLLNKKAQFLYPQLLHRESPFIELFQEAEVLTDLLDEVKKELTKKTIKVHEKEKESSLTLEVQGIFDEYEDFYWYIMVFSSSPSFEAFKKKYAMTPTQWEISLLLLQGMEYKEIADSRNISFFTVKNHVHQIYDKTNCKNRYELQALFYE